MNKKQLTENDFTFKTQPLKHQIEALIKSADKVNFAYLMEMGCVDGETEFLSNRGWVKFKDFDLSSWEEPLLVGQCIHPTYNAEHKHVFTFVQPTNYIKKKVNTMYHFTGTIPRRIKPCVDIMVTPDHNMRCRIKYKDEIIKHIKDDVIAEQTYDVLCQRSATAKTYDMQRAEILQQCWYHGGICNKNYPISPLENLNQWELRVLVAIAADGNFPHKNSNRCMMEFSKEHKIERFEMLCKKAGILAVKEIIRGGKSTRFNLVAPARKKIYDEDFWLLSPAKQSAIFDEVFYWDGSIDDTRKRFYTIHKQSADFIQFLCFTHGFRGNILTGVSNDAPYYTVSIDPRQTEEETDITYATVTEATEIKKEQYAYCFRVPEGALVLRRNDKVFITGNSGKTKVMIDNMAYLKQKGAISGAIVLAPKGVYRNWSTQEIPKHMPDELNYKLLIWKAEGTASYKKKLIDDINNYDKSEFPILIFNIESVNSQAGLETITAFLKAHKGNVMGLLDESTCIKNHKAKRTKKALEIASKCKVKRIATGSPITNSPLDLFSQFAFLDKGILRCGSYYAFRNAYAEIERITTRQGQSFDKILKYKNLNILSRLIEPYSFRITKKECLDLPEKIYVTRDVELTPEQKQLYKEMKNLYFATLDGEVMSVQVALTKMLRLHQILCGSFTTDTGEIRKIPNNRLVTLMDVLSETSGKVIIWANYLANVYDIQEALKQAYGKESFVTYIGETSTDDRVENIKLFQDPISPVRFFIGNVATAGRGITLTEANTVIYYSNSYSLEMRQQSEDRAHRVGQKNPVLYIDLVARNSIDEKIIQALLAKRNIANEILHDDLEDWIKL